MNGQKKSAGKIVFLIGAGFAALGVIGLIVMMYFESQGLDKETLRFGMGLGASAMMNGFQTMIAYLALYWIPLAIIGGICMGIGYYLQMDDQQAGKQNQQRGYDTPPRQDYHNQPAPGYQPRQEYYHNPAPQQHYGGGHGHHHSSGVSRTLKADNGVLAGQYFRFNDVLVIGRDSSCCDVVFPSGTRGVSRKHCTLRLHNGKVTLMDENSTHGTYVDGKRIMPGGAVTVHRGQRISVGSIKQTFVLHS